MVVPVIEVAGWSDAAAAAASIQTVTRFLDIKPKMFTGKSKYLVLLWRTKQ